MYLLSIFSLYVTLVLINGEGYVVPPASSFTDAAVESNSLTDTAPAMPTYPTPSISMGVEAASTDSKDQPNAVQAGSPQPVSPSGNCNDQAVSSSSSTSTASVLPESYRRRLAVFRRVMARRVAARAVAVRRRAVRKL